MVQEPVQPAPVEEQELPIDIDHTKFLSWLVDRRRVPRDWHTYLKSARALVRHAITTTPPSARAFLNLDLPSATSTPLPYFRAVDVLSALTSPDAPPEWLAGPEKDLLGRFKGATARAWSDAVTAFQKKHVYLVDCAQALSRNADLEAPAIKASIARLHTDVAEYARRDAPAVRSAADARDRFRVACQEFALPAEGDVDYQMLLADAVSKRVPELIAEAVGKAKHDNFVCAVEYYEKFAKYIQGQGNDDGTQLCQTVRLVIAGDVNELTKLVMPVQAEMPVEPDVEAVDWDISTVEPIAGTAGAEIATEIDWGIEIATSGTTMEDTTTLVKGNEVTAVAESGNGTEDNTIDWNEIAVDTADDSFVKEGDASADQNKISLVDSTSREFYLNDLIELDSFLAQRSAELSLSGNTEIRLVMQQASDVPEFVKATDSDRVMVLQKSVQQAISAINSPETRRILALHSDEKRLKRAARDILGKKHVAERMHAAIDLLRQRRARAAADLSAEMPKFEELAKSTRDIKKRTEEALSSLYKGRTVNILGEINNVFPPLQ